METERSHQLMIFCDGGIGNRINALVSGLAVARHFNLSYCVYWPENNWCQAGFHDIFQNNFPVSKLSIKNLKGTLADSIVMLHDEIASDNLSVDFNSAYQYTSLHEFSEKVLSTGKEVFFYPAIMPDWIPFADITFELQQLVFRDRIQSSVSEFIQGVLKKPFHGLHLRRTDLNVGLSDHEVLNLVQRNPQETFFVCSDDPIAEALASVHPNVHARSKSSNVSKKFSDSDWLSKSPDDDGRIYHGNIMRGKEAVIEGTIDLLILAHSKIVGYSGSTFQRMAKIIGESSPLVSIEKPTQLNYFSPKEIQRQLDARLLSAGTLIAVCNSIGAQGDMQEAITLLQKGCAQFEGADYLDLLHTLGVFFLNQSQPKLARLFLSEVTNQDEHRYSSWLHLAYANFLMSDLKSANNALNRSSTFKPLNLAQAEDQLSAFLTMHISTGSM